MLSASKIGIHGMRDERWTIRDKTTQYNKVISLYRRDQEQTKRDVAELRKLQFADIKRLKKQVQEYRGLLSTARQGDKQRIRNILRSHRPTQIAFMEQPFQKALEHLQEANFHLKNEKNQLSCMRMRRAKRLLHLKTDAGVLEQLHEKKLRERTTSAEEQNLTSQISNAFVKQNAAISVTYTYENVLAILKKDTIYFDAVLQALQKDLEMQCRCLLRATEMGQAAAEELATLRVEIKSKESDVKQKMEERAQAVASLRETVEQNRDLCKNLVRIHSDSDLRFDDNTKQVDSMDNLIKELHSMESLIQKLQGVTLVSTYIDIFPRFEEQLRQRERLLQQIYTISRRRDDELSKRNHAKVKLHNIQHTMSSLTHENEKETLALSEQIKSQNEMTADFNEKMQYLGNEMLTMRTALYTINSVLNEVKPPISALQSLSSKYLWSAEEELMDSLYATKYGSTRAPDANAMALLKAIYSKIGVLNEQLTAINKVDIPYHLVPTRPIRLDAIVKSVEISHLQESLDSLMFGDAEDKSVPTRAAIKLQSSKIVEIFERPPEAAPLYRMKRVRKEDKWI